MIFWPAAICSRCNLHFSDLWEQEWMTRINCTKLEPMWGTKKKIVLYIKQIICNFVFCVVESLYTLPVEEMSSLALPKTPLVFLRLPIHLYLNHLAPILHSPVSPPISFSVLVGVTSFFFFFFLRQSFWVLWNIIILEKHSTDHSTSSWDTNYIIGDWSDPRI